MLAETIQLSGPETAALLAIFVAFLLALLALYAGTVLAAYGAGKGSRVALVVWAPIVGVETVWTLALVLEPSRTWWWPLAALGGQIFGFFRGRQKSAA